VANGSSIADARAALDALASELLELNGAPLRGRLLPTSRLRIGALV
jgi:hypothetical protein